MTETWKQYPVDEPLTLRDRFALIAFESYLTDNRHYTKKSQAIRVWQLADAMIEQRTKGDTQ